MTDALVGISVFYNIQELSCRHYKFMMLVNDIVKQIKKCLHLNCIIL